MKKVNKKFVFIGIIAVSLGMVGILGYGYEGDVGNNVELPGSEYRVLYGSNYWQTSNLREWLNSADEKVKYTCQPPSADKLGNNAYDMEPGFLSEFTEEERDAIAITKHRVFISSVDGSVKTGGSVSIPLSLISTNSLTFSVPNLESNGLEYRYQDVLDKVYLLNTYELYVYVQQRGYDLRKSLTSAAKKKYSYYNDYINYWLCSSGTSPYGEYLHAINTSGNIVSIQSPKSLLGVVPVINLKPDYRLSNGKLARELSIGEIVTFGKYLGEPIEWRVINIQDGYPMLWAEKAVTIKVFDTPGDTSLAYSKYIDFSDASYIDRSVPAYMANDGGTDITPPSFTITNEDTLFTRQNGSFTLHFRVTDNSGVKGIILPNDETITDTAFDYTFSQNGYYLFIAYDNSDNYRYFMVPVGNVNVPATVEIKPSADGWTNKDVTVDIFATCDVGFELSERVQNNRDVHYRESTWTNYTTYAQKQIRVTGDVELVSADKPVGNVTVGPGFGMTLIGKTEEGFYLYPAWIRATSISLKTLQDEGKQHFDVVFEVPGNFFSDIYPWFQIGVSGLERSYTIRWSNIKCELLDKEDLKIEKIILPTGQEIIGQSSYRDILTEEGVYKYTVIDNRGMVYEKTITVLIDKVPPTINITADKVLPTNQDVVLTAIASDNRSGVKEVKLPNGSTTSNTIVTFNVRVNGDYTFQVTDLAGNVTVKTFKVSNIDRIPPEISMLSVEPLSSTSVLINVSARDPEPGGGLSELPYKYYRDGVSITDWTFKNTYTDLGLSPNTRYIYAIHVRDAAGNITTSDEVAVYTLANKPLELKAVFNGSGILVTWNDNGNPHYTRYEIEYKADSDNSVIITGTSYKIKNIEFGKRYAIRIRAVNEDGRCTDFTDYVYVDTIAIDSFKIVNIRDVRWRNYFDFPIGESKLPVENIDGLDIGLGYGIDFEIDTIGFGGLNDRIIIDISFEDSSGRELNLYVKDKNNYISLKDVDTFKGTQYTKITLTSSNRIYVGTEGDIDKYKWKGYYFLPFTICDMQGNLPDGIMVIFNIRAEDSQGIVVNFRDNLKVFKYNTKRTAYDDIFIEQFR